MDNQLLYTNKINSTLNSSSQLSNNITQKETNSTSIKLFIDAIPQNLLLICILILFILFLILIIIILIYLIKKRKKLLLTETIVNNNIDINKMILHNSKKPNINEFHQIRNNSNINDCSLGVNNISLTELKTKNLKEEIHSIVSETLSEMTLNKAKKLRKKKKENPKRKSGQISIQNENNEEKSNKELKSENID